MTQFEKIPDLQKIFNKYEVSSEAQKELKDAFEKMIVQAFYKNASGDPKVVKRSAPTTSTVDEDRDGKCTGKCYPGTAKEKPCPNKATVGNYCKRHDPNKTGETSGASKKTKKHEHNCHGIIKTTKNQCSSAGTVKPDGADFHYCKRHSEKWKDFEEDAKIDEDE